MINRKSVFCAMILAAAGTGAVAAQAQTGQGDSPTGMPMMRMGAMSGSMHQVVMTPFLLPQLQSELGLSAQQLSQLRQLKQDMLAKGKDFSSQIAAKEKELDALLIAGTSKGDQVKKLFEHIANLRAQQLYAGYETTAKMKATLTEAQRTKLAAMKPYELHEAMMSRMTMGDMTQMMQYTGGEGMMSSPIMMGGMMGHGMMHEGGPSR